MRWSPRTSAWRQIFLAAAVGVLVFPSTLLSAEYPEPVVLSTDVSRDYHRVRLADGTYRRETYAFVQGSHIGTGGIDLSLDHMGFYDLIRLLAPPLAKDGYVPEANPNKIQLMIMVHWGMTVGSEDTQGTPGMDYLSMSSSALGTAPPPGGATGGSLGGPPSAGGGGGMSQSGNPFGGGSNDDGALSTALSMIDLDNHTRDEKNAINARIVGMEDGLDFAHFAPNVGSARDVISDLEMDRYYVVLQAYDFQKSWKEKKLKLLWDTRFSIRAPGRHFDQQLPTMILAAAPYFGRDSHGMRSRDVPNGNVIVGVPRVVGTVPAPLPPPH